MFPELKNIVFDLGGVLIDLHRDRCVEAFRRLGFPQIEDLLNPYYPKGVFSELEGGAITVEQACRRIGEMAGREIPCDEIRQAYKAFLGEIAPYKLRAIDALREAGLRTYVLSNNNAMVFPHIENTLFAADGKRMADYFDAIYLSFRMHLLKPSPEIFRAMIADSGMKPEETLFLDDGERNVATAHQLGFHVYMPRPGEDFSPLLREIALR
ncbi:MAG: HAD family hydrolase [Alistipes sp.]|jgi:HAD hydrolase, family IA, variant 3|uniref:HAD family hydrolase n=1 Tax=Alistipes sp. TaxID=1872444 RepID=UPI0011CAAB93|nr:HAD family phosphatase [Alistipes sp.]MBS6099228.1 HAD family phosphatase [Alistipes sp.]HJI18424.1 HAD family phosphatase [Rikenellaceae bacterium]